MAPGATVNAGIGAYAPDANATWIALAGGATAYGPDAEKCCLKRSVTRTATAGVATTGAKGWIGG